MCVCVCVGLFSHIRSPTRTYSCATIAPEIKCVWQRRERRKTAHCALSQLTHWFMFTGFARAHGYFFRCVVAFCRRLSSHIPVMSTHTSQGYVNMLRMTLAHGCPGHRVSTKSYGAVVFRWVCVCVCQLAPVVLWRATPVPVLTRNASVYELFRKRAATPSDNKCTTVRPRDRGEESVTILPGAPASFYWSKCRRTAASDGVRNYLACDWWCVSLSAGWPADLTGLMVGPVGEN